MAITTVTSREFNQNIRRLEQASLNGPVFITEKGQPAYVLLAIQDYEKLTKAKESIVGLLTMPDTADSDFEPVKLNKDLYHPEGFN
jgi:PHD/YefM family antitoxin component YafN of YafNO toxin-antitoxin module